MTTNSPEKQREYNRKYRAANKEKIAARENEKYHANKDVFRGRRFKYKYGITLADYNKMFKKQKGRCAICGAHQSELKEALRVDHNHDTGKVRGLLCHHCNTGAGNFRDDPILLRKAAKYMGGK